MDMNCILRNILCLWFTELHLVQVIQSQCDVVARPDGDVTEGSSGIVGCQTNNECSRPTFVQWRKCSITGETTCDNVAVYFPSNNSLETFPDIGYDIKSRTWATIEDIPLIGGTVTALNFTNLIAKDSGTWGCKTQDAESVELPFIVQVPPSTVTLQPTDRDLISNDTMQLTLTVNRVNPLVSIKWSIDNKEQNETSSNTEINDGAWKVTSSYSNTFLQIGKMNVQCFAIYENGNEMDLTEITEYTIHASPSIHEPKDDAEENPDINSDLVLSCVASGDITSIEWLKDDNILQEENILFNKPEETTVTGSYPYGQTKAIKSELKWKQPEKSTCESIVRHNGIYYCNATVTAGSQTSSQRSPLTTVDVLYAPIRNMSESDINVNSDGTDAFQVTCKVCARPAPTFRWKYKSGDLPKDVVDFGNGTIQINSVNCEHCGMYTCIAENEYDFVNIEINVIEPIVTGLKVGEIIGIVIGICACVCLGVGLFFFIRWKKRKEKDGEVVAYAESGNNGVTVANRSTNGGNSATAPPVYAEVKKDTKKKTDEPTGPVYSQVNKPGQRPLPQLKPKPSTGSKNTGPVYSEVNKPKKGRLTPIETQHHGGGNKYEEAGYIGGKPLPPIGARHYDNAGQMNDHGGLHYADVDFNKQGKGTKHSYGTKNPSYEPTEYAQIDHRKSAGIVV